MFLLVDFGKVLCLFAICTSPITHQVCPPLPLKFCSSIAFDFSQTTATLTKRNEKQRLCRFYVISMEFLSLRHADCLSWRNVPSGEKRGETAIYFRRLDLQATSNLIRQKDKAPILISHRQARVGHLGTSFQSC